MKLNYFNFKEFKGRILLTNDMGRFTFIERQDFWKLLSGNLEFSSPVGKKLLETGMVFDCSDLEFSEKRKWDLLASKSHLTMATSLHIFVVTTACNMNCVYCQANNGTTTPNCFMNTETAERAVNIALQSPERNLSFEFQGGEPLLNFEIIKHIIKYTEKNKNGKCVAYNVVSNLTLLNEEMLEFFSNYNVSISTSVDGSEMIHNLNRPFKDGTGSFQKVCSGIRRIKERGLSVGAIETTTKNTLPYATELIATYRELGFNSIFIRHLTQLGKAAGKWDSIGYTAEQFLEFYRKAVDELILLNRQGDFLQEQHAAILLKKINGVIINYMELRSPCGGGIGQLAYFADGRIFTCDEGRMLAEMGNDAFLLGNVYEDTYKSIITGNTCKAICAASTLETIPSCCDCVYQPYCGTCPVINYAVTDDILEKNPRTFRCQVYSGMLDYLFELIMDGNSEIIEVLNRWSY